MTSCERVELTLGAISTDDDQHHSASADCIHSSVTMGRSFLQTLVILSSLLLLQVAFTSRVEWRRLPSSFSAPILQHENVTTNTTTQWWHPLIYQTSRVWNSIHTNYSWCIPQHSQWHARHYIRKARDVSKAQLVDGLVFVKTPKAASSTGAGISLRIAKQVGNRLYNTSCSVNYTHPFAFFRGHAKRSPNKSLLWTIVREPVERQLSAYSFFFLTRRGLTTANITNTNITDFLTNSKGGQFQYIATRKRKSEYLESASLKQRQDLVGNLLQFYHFIAIAERMDESLVAMKMLFGLHHDDLIVLPSKVGYDSHTCRRVEQIPITKELKEFLQTNFTVDNIDYLLYNAANLSLDRTIKRLGRERFQVELKEHQRLQALAERECTLQELPCSKNGTARKECYADDSGCGYPCVDRVLHADAASKHTVDDARQSVA